MTDWSVFIRIGILEATASPSPAPSRRRLKEARPAQLIAAAFEVFAEKGFAATRLEDVARRAGLAKGTAYLYFPNKEALFKAAIREAVVARIAMGERDVEEWQGSSQELLQRMLEQWAEVIRTHRGGFLKLIIAEAKNFPDLAEWYQREVADRGQRLMAAILRRGMERGEFRLLDPEATALVIAGPMCFRAISTDALGCHETRPVPDERFFATHFDILLAGLRRVTPENAKD
jgi:TetR/AcrR family transcriptional regulator